MKILRIDERCFLVETNRDYENVALKLLNERRVLGVDINDPRLQEFIEQVTDAQDGEMAMAVVYRLYEVELIVPEVII